MKKYIMAAVNIILVLLAAVSILQGAKNALHFSQDFQYDAALALRNGIDPYDESLSPTGILKTGPTAEFYRVFEENGTPQKMEANQFPSLLMLLFPVTFLPFKTARILWLILNLLFTAGIVFLLSRTFFRETDRRVFIVLMLLMLCGTPYRNQLGVGQHTLFSFFFFLLSLYLSEKGKTVLSGLSLSVSYFKYTLTAPLALYFLYKKRYREFIISLVPHVLLTGAAALMLGESPADMIIKPLKVASALSGEGSIDIGAITGGGIVSMIITAVVMLCCLILVFTQPRGKEKGVFTVLLLLSLIMTYHRIYDFFVLFVVSAGISIFAGFPEKRVITWCYRTVLVTFNFLLRIFNESRPSLLAATILYYGFVVLYLWYFLKFLPPVPRRHVTGEHACLQQGTGDAG